MKLNITEKNEILLEEVYTGIILKSPAGEQMGICMRDGGFEFQYNGQWYAAKEGKVEMIPFGQSVEGAVYVPDTETITDPKDDQLAEFGRALKKEAGDYFSGDFLKKIKENGHDLSSRIDAFVADMKYRQIHYNNYRNFINHFRNWYYTTSFRNKFRENM